MPSRIARTAWTGTVQEGAGRVELVSSQVGTFDVTFPHRAADEAGGFTSPEELIAAAHTSCYAMRFSGLAAAAGGIPKHVTVTATVTLGPDPEGGSKLTGIALIVRGHVEGFDDEKFQSVAEEAKKSCPISKALQSVEITLDAQRSVDQ